MIKEIKKRGKNIWVKELKVKDLDKSKCSYKFLQHNFPDEHIVNVKCFKDGTLDLRGRKQEYRIIK
jgi:hypothetical protein